MKTMLADLIRDPEEEKRKADRHLARELISWAVLQHDNILRLSGICMVESHSLRMFGMVAPWLEHGHAINYLKNNAERPRSLLLRDIAQGLMYLHSAFQPPLIHGDLKASNVLVDITHRAVLADFGLTGTKPDIPDDPASQGLSRTIGNERWKAPEMLMPATGNEMGADLQQLSC
ncbi:kinase-like protein [Calocera cornea HHB12733]|uniref:Kinase-like protein n=1 Tax=Calocera cornea HHB12733 TaxID=1353952 RepID=A0A165EIC9_9BASI|nr:kinase-like protein [Calocera cornea HHB12733]